MTESKIDLDKVNSNGKKEISNQIRYFKDRLVGYSELSYSDIYRITEVEKLSSPDYKITDVESIRKEAAKRYDNIMKISEDSLYQNVYTNDEKDDDSSESGDNMYGVFKSILALLTIFIIGVLSYRVKWGNFIKPSGRGSMNLLQFMGLFVIIVGFNYVVGQFMDIMKIKTQKTDNDTIKDIIDKIKEIKDIKDELITEDNKKVYNLIKEFFKQNYDIVKKDSTYNIKLTKTIDSFLKKQEQFMMKSENIGMKNSVFKNKVNKSLNFFTGKSTMQIAKEYVISNKNYSAIRNKDSEIDLFGKKLKTFRYKDDIYEIEKNEQGIQISMDSTYEDIFQKSIFKDELAKLTTYLNQSALPDVSTCLEIVVRINKYLAILEHMGLPEYRSLKYEFFFKNTPELLTFFDLKDRYNFKDEVNVLMRLKDNFDNCGNKELSSQSEFVNDECSAVSASPNKILEAYNSIISKFVEDNNDISINRVHMFIKKINDEVVSKKEMTSKAKYNDVLDNITTVVREIFKYSNITKKDLILLFKTEIRTTDDIVSNPDIFMNNIRKVLDVVFLNLEEYKKNHSILDNDKNSIKRQEYIVFDQFLHKIADYQENDYEKLENELDTLTSYVDQIVLYRSENSIDLISKKKIKLFEEVVYIYITSSLPFLIDFILRGVYGNTDCETDENDANDTIQSGGAGVLPDLYGLSNQMSNAVDRFGKQASAAATNFGEKASAAAAGVGKQASATATGVSENMSAAAAGVGKQASVVKNKVKNTVQSAKDKLVSTENDSIRTKIKSAKDKLTDGVKCPINVLNISVYFSGWFFSVIVLYTYWLKMDTQVNYNISVKLANSADINNAFMNVKNPVSKLKESKANEYENKKELYEAIIELLELQSKCNLLRFNEDSIPFPTTEIILTLFLIFLCCAVIISQNLLNNPFEAMRKIKMIQRSQKNKKYIANRLQIVDLVKSLMKDALDAKFDRINILLKKVDPSDENTLKELKDSRSSLQSKIKSLDIDNYNSKAINEIEANYPNSQSIIQPILEKVSEYIKMNTNEDAEFNQLFNTLDDIDTIYEDYKSTLDRLRKKELISNEQRGGIYNENPIFDGNQQGGNPMMITPYGMNFVNNSEQIKADYKLESMKEMMKYTEEEENMLNELKQLDNSIMDINSTFTNITLAFGLIGFSVFVSYKILNNSLNFKSELLNGKLFGEGICYK
uniref:Uncharacterized protein n=1 Tax=viral metagenome TaxID=1070528 RepID=A0A6C0CVL9_9ZZZZ